MAEKERQSRPRGEAPEPRQPAMVSNLVPLPGLAEIPEGRLRAVIDAVLPVLDGGRFPIKCIAGEPVPVEAHCFTDGHDKLRAVLSWHAVGDTESYEVEMTPEVNDVWTAAFTPPVPGRYRYTVSAWVDHFESWRRDLARRDDPGDVAHRRRHAVDHGREPAAWRGLLERLVLHGR